MAGLPDTYKNMAKNVFKAVLQLSTDLISIVSGKIDHV